MPQPTFRTRVHGIYSRMRDRSKDRLYKTGRLAGQVRRKGWVIPFTEKEMYEELLRRRGSEDKPYPCRYCSRWITLMVCVLDHAVPLKQGGSAGLDNLDDICEPCNSIKGGMLPESFMKLMAFLLTLPSTCSTDMRTRLQRANKHAGQVRSMMVRLGAYGKKGAQHEEA